MLVLKICIIIGGILSVFMIIFHSQFYKLFNWKKDFERITQGNQKIFYTIHFALIFLFIAFACFSLIYTDELSQCTGVAFGITLSYSLFWLWRTIWQIIYFNPHKSNNVQKLVFLHYFLVFIFLMLFIVYLIPVIFKIFGKY